jgi:hypothetical protein
VHSLCTVSLGIGFGQLAEPVHNLGLGARHRFENHPDFHLAEFDRLNYLSFKKARNALSET